jgi:hypothetical protein
VLCGSRALMFIGGVDIDVLGMGSDDELGGGGCVVLPRHWPGARVAGAGLVIWDDGLGDVEVRLRRVFDFNVWVVGRWWQRWQWWGQCVGAYVLVYWISIWSIIRSIGISMGRFHQVVDLTITSSLLLPLYNVESSIFQSQIKIQVSTYRNQRTPGSCTQHRGRWSAINSRSIQRACRCCWGSRIKGRRRGPAVCYRCNQGIDINSLIIPPINEQTENISKCGRS